MKPAAVLPILCLSLVVMKVHAQCNEVTCLVAPCQTAVCAGAPEGTKCRDNYCGGCNAEFSVDGLEVRCGQTCSANQHCNDGDFCYKPTCGNSTGICAAKPQMCIEIFAPVCDCDGKTHPNSCYAHGGGSLIASQGECKPTKTDADKAATSGPAVDNPNKVDITAQLTATLAALRNASSACSSTCDSKSACFLGSGCVAQGASCKPKPELCTMQFSPVCGCDGNVYGNSCEAESNGATVYQPLDLDNDMEILRKQCTELIDSLLSPLISSAPKHSFGWSLSLFLLAAALAF